MLDAVARLETLREEVEKAISVAQGLRMVRERADVVAEESLGAKGRTSPP